MRTLKLCNDEARSEPELCELTGVATMTKGSVDVELLMVLGCGGSMRRGGCLSCFDLIAAECPEEVVKRRRFAKLSRSFALLSRVSGMRS